MSSSVYHQTSAGFAATAAAFVTESLGLIIPWLMVMGVVILGDLVAGITRAFKMREKVRFSRACRDTMAKTCTYFAWVVAACWVQVACGNDAPYAKWACMAVVFIEASSIMSNILKWHGYRLDLGLIVSYVLGKLTHADPHELDGIVTPDEDADADGRDGDKEPKR